MSQPRTTARQPLGIAEAVTAVIDDLDRQLQNPQEKKAVHRIRVDIKRLRAWLRMIRHNAGGFDWKSHDRHLRDLAGQLSAKRDTQVIMDTLTWLEKKADGGAPRHAIERVRSHVRFDLGRHEADWPYIRKSLAAETDSLRNQVVLLDDRETASEGMKYTYKRADKRGGRAFSNDGTIEEMHQFRKWVKYLYYQVGFVRNANQALYGKAGKRLNELGDKLGRIHDLDILERKVAAFSEAGDCVESAAIVLGLIERRKEKLIKRCNRLYRKVFSKSPAAFVRRLN